MNDKNDIDIVFDVSEKKQLSAIRQILEEKDVSGSSFFRPHLISLPTIKRQTMIEMFTGRRDMFLREKIKNPKKEDYFEDGLWVEKNTREDEDDWTDEPNWKHLAIVFSGPDGEIHNVIKRPVDVPRTITNRQGEEEIVIRHRWEEKFNKKILVCIYDTLPEQEAMARYDRVWFVNPDIIRSVRKKCRRCDDYMVWEDDLFHMTCTNDDCPYLKKHKVALRVTHERVFWVGKDFKNLDAVEEYHRVMD